MVRRSTHQLGYDDEEGLTDAGRAALEPYAPLFAAVVSMSPERARELISAPPWCLVVDVGPAIGYRDGAHVYHVYPYIER
jgi:hypothetical protein